MRGLVVHSYRIHSHLDWQDTDQWLESDDVSIRLAWAGGRLVGVMGTSSPLHHTCWLRLAAVHDDVEPQPVLNSLWADLAYELRALTVHTVALLVLRDWIARYAPELGFRYQEDIVTLRRANLPPPDLEATDLTIRATTPDDIETMTRIDQAAFTPPWQLTISELRQAERASAICTVALRENALLGYQLSTLYFDGAHLARLAVDPSAQGRGVGRALLIDLLQRLDRRSIHSATVNTQASNTRSQRLYAGFGFERNGYDLPVWFAKL